MPDTIKGTYKLTDVPPEDVDEVVGDFKAEGAKTVTKERQPSGNYTVTAVFD